MILSDLIEHGASAHIPAFFLPPCTIPALSMSLSSVLQVAGLSPVAAATSCLVYCRRRSPSGRSIVWFVRTRSSVLKQETVNALFVVPADILQNFSSLWLLFSHENTQRKTPIIIIVIIIGVNIVLSSFRILTDLRYCRQPSAGCRLPHTVDPQANLVK